MHCASCAVVIADAIKAVVGVSEARVDQKSATLIVTVDHETTPERLAAELNPYIKDGGYTLSAERQQHQPKWRDFTVAVPIAILFIALFVLLQKAGILNSLSADTMSYPVVFLIGIVASLSSCLAVVGGLLLSISANYAKGRNQLLPQSMFHAGRLVSFVVFGGLVGLLGSAFTLSIGLSVGLGVGVGVVMLVLGLNLLDVFPWARRFQPRLPRSLQATAGKIHGLNHTLAPLLIGASTFFLPCGFTQSMQIYTLSTGGFAAGALTMGVYALGTLPVLGLISFGAFKLSRGRWASVFFKTAGLLVIAFALLNILTSLVAAGLIPPFINF